tara:strand:- start:187 stop:756 length:570 start_codon:yes stop_codon:yes gene_type:complete
MALTRLGLNQAVNLATNVTGTLATGNGGTGATSFAPGKIGQVVQSGSDYSVVSTSTSYVDFESSSGTAWETAITPSATSSKILVMSTLDIRGSRSGANDGRCFAKMMRKIGSGSYSDVAIAAETVGGYDFGASGIWIKGCVNFMNLISPNTTDAVTFKFAGKSGASGAEFAFNGGSSAVTKCTLLEVFA